MRRESARLSSAPSSSARSSAYASSAPQATRDDPQLPIIEQDGLPIFHDPIDASLTPQQCAAISHLVSGRTYSTTATLIGVSRKTIYNWRQIPAFRNALHSLSRESCQAAAMRVRNILLRGTRKLEKLVEGHLSLSDTLKIVSNKRVWDIASAIEASLVGPEPDECPNDPLVEEALAELMGEEETGAHDSPRAQGAATASKTGDRETQTDARIAPPATADAVAPGEADLVRAAEISSAADPAAFARVEGDGAGAGGIRAGTARREECAHEGLAREERLREGRSREGVSLEGICAGEETRSDVEPSREESSSDPSSAGLLSRLAAESRRIRTADPSRDRRDLH